jgi:hypothetical protein
VPTTRRLSKRKGAPEHLYIFLKCKNMNDKIPTYYLLSKNKIEPIPKSLESHKDYIYHADETVENGIPLLDSLGYDLKRIISILEEFDLQISTVACIENMNESLISEFILKETFDAIFFIKNEEDSGYLRFAHSLLNNMDSIREDLENSLNFLNESDLAVELCGTKEIKNFYSDFNSDIHNAYIKNQKFNGLILNYLKSDLLKYIKLD